MNELKSRRVLENWLRDTTTKVYAQIADELDKEVETSLKSFEATISQMKLDRQKKEGEITRTLEELERIERKLDHVAAVIEPVKAKISGALNNQRAV